MQKNRNPIIQDTISDIKLLNELSLKDKPTKKGYLSSRKNNHVITSDYHAPYTSIENFHKVCVEYSQEASTLHLVGDILDGGCLSSHSKISKCIDLETEVNFTICLIYHALKYFDNVKIYTGNHDLKRFKKALHKDIPDSLHFLVSDPFEYIKSHFEKYNGRVEFVSTPIYSTKNSESWFGVIGKDAIVTHSEAYSANNVSIIRTFEWFQNWNKPLKLVEELRFISQGHTHQLSLRMNAGCMLVENGSMVSLSGLMYQFDGNCKYKSVNQNGACILYQDNKGYTLQDKTRVIPLPLY